LRAQFCNRNPRDSKGTEGEDTKRKPLWISTEIEATEENKEEAESKCLSARIQYSVDLKNGVVETTSSKRRKPITSVKAADKTPVKFRDPLFTDLLNEWLAFRHPDNIVVGEDFNFDKKIKLNTWAGYADNIKHNLYPTFMAYGCTIGAVSMVCGVANVREHENRSLISGTDVSARTTQ